METIILVAALLIGAVLVVLFDTRNEQKRQATKFGSFGKTQVINFSTVGLMIALAYVLTISIELFSGIVIYLVIGILVNRSAGVPTSDDLKHLSLNDRLLLSAFHASLWPYYAFRRSSI
jgi:uncharacterized membrane protein YraQ (UPF0718 family)